MKLNTLGVSIIATLVSLAFFSVTNVSAGGFKECRFVHKEGANNGFLNYDYNIVGMNDPCPLAPNGPPTPEHPDGVEHTFHYQHNKESYIEYRATTDNDAECIVRKFETIYDNQAVW